MDASQLQRKPARAEPLLELEIDADKRGQVDSRTPIRWCVGRSILEEIESRGFRNPYIVVIVRNRVAASDYDQAYRYWQDTAIYAAPLTAELMYVSFTRPGRNDLRAFVIEMNLDAAKWIREIRGRIRKADGESILDEAGHLSERVARYKGMKNSLKWFDTTARQRVIVPAEMFAPEPAGWRKALVYAVFGSNKKGRDQCDFRKRFIFAVPACLVLVPGMFALKVAGTALWMAFGSFPKRSHWRYFKPLNFDWDLDEMSDSWWWNGKKALVLGFLNPPVLLILPSVVWLVLHVPLRHYHTVVDGHSHGHHVAWYPMSWISLVKWVDGSLIALVLGAATLVVAVLVLAAGIAGLAAHYPKSTRLAVKFILEPIQWAQRRWRQWRDAAEQDRRRKAQEAIKKLELELIAMTCRADARQVSLAALPEEKQTVYLRFQDLKTKVWRPFAV